MFNNLNAIVEKYKDHHVIDKLKRKKKVIVIGSQNEIQTCVSFLATYGIIVSEIYVFKPGDCSFEECLVANYNNNAAICISSSRAKAVIRYLHSIGVNDFFNLSGIPEYFDYISNYFDPEVIIRDIEPIKKVYSLMSDKVSQDILLGLIWYRLTMNFSNILYENLWEQYFHPIVCPKKHDVIFDGGARIGDTALRFAEFLEKECSIVSFEPEAKNYELMVSTIAKYNLEENIVPYQLGLWSYKGTLYLNISNDSDYSGAHQITEQGDVSVEVTDIDSFVDETQRIPDIIKLDIEGSEREALLGAKETIMRYKPDLIVCLYHKVDDLWTIPILIHEILPEYKFYLGHHDPAPSETVLYVTARR